MKSEDKAFMKDFSKQLESTIQRFNLLDKKDKVIVACSGGKDSTALLYLLNKLGYDVTALTIDVSIGDYSKKNLENIRKYCKEWKIPLIETSFKKEFGYSLCYIKDLLKSKNINIRSCTICGVLRRYIINRISRETKATKVATGHNLDDEAQNYLMNIFKTNLGINARLGPVSGLIKDKKFIPRIKPFYLTPEKEIEKYAKHLGLDLVYTKCPCSVDAYRNALRQLLNEYEPKINKIKQNIIRDFLANSEKYKQRFATKEKISYCKLCNEPCKETICKSCQLINLIKA